MKQITKKLFRFLRLIMLVCGFLIIVPISAPTSSTRSAVQFQPSPSQPTPQEQTEKRRNPVRRFFSWLTEVVSRPFRKRVRPISDPPIVLISSSTALINFCPPWTESVDNCSAKREVELSATAGGPEVDAKLVFEWAVSAGRIRGQGQKVIWDLSDVAAGSYTANVVVYDRTGLAANASTRVTIALCPNCITRESPCPTVAVSCPENAESTQRMTFQAHVYGGDPAIKPTYTWAISAGKISGGQGTSTLTIDVSDVTRRASITATVSIGGYDPRCLNTASCTTQRAGEVGMARLSALSEYESSGVTSLQQMKNGRLFNLPSIIELNGEPSRARTCDPLIKSAFMRTASTYGSYDLLTFVAGCSRQGVNVLPPTTVTFAGVLSQVCRNRSRSGPRASRVWSPQLSRSISSPVLLRRRHCSNYRAQKSIDHL